MIGESEQISPYVRTSQVQDNSMVQTFQEFRPPPEHKYIEMQKFSSAYYKDNNEEEYAIQRAFQGNNFNYLRKLPTNFQRNCVLQQRQNRVKDQISQQTQTRLLGYDRRQQIRKDKINEKKKQKIGTLGYFQIFPYKQSDYEIPKMLARQQHKQKTEKRKQISQLDFRPNGFDVKMKYEDPFQYKDRLQPPSLYKQPYLFPFHLPDDVYDQFQQSQRRLKLIKDQLKLAGEFLPSKSGQALRTTTKSKLPEIINEIEHYIKKYLKNVAYFIGVNKKDHIEVVFQGKHAQDMKVQMAMSGILEHQMLTKFVLRKKLDHWGTINITTNYLEYVMLPQWVKQQEKLRVTH